MRTVSLPILVQHRLHFAILPHCAQEAAEKLMRDGVAVARWLAGFTGVYWATAVHCSGSPKCILCLYANQAMQSATYRL